MNTTLKIRALIFVVWLAGLQFFTGMIYAAPSAPTGLSAFASTSDQIYVSWNEVNDATNYVLQWKQDGGNWQEIAGYPYDNYQHLNRKCNTNYSYRVAAYSLSTGQSAWSNTASAKTLACPPGPSAPSNLKATAKGQTEIGLTWNDVQGETGYEVEYSTNGQNFSLLHVTGANQASMNDVALKCGTARHYRVRAVNNNGKSTYSNTAFASTTACPEQPIVVELLTNGGFETNADGKPNLPDSWIAKGGMSGDKVVNTSYGNGYFVYAGNNAMLFRGDGVANDRIYQGVNMNKVAFHVGDKLYLSARINHVRGGDDTKLVWATVAYSDGTKTDIKLNTQADLNGGFVYRGNFTTLTRTDITAIVVRVAYNKSNGKLAIDNVSLTLTKGEEEKITGGANPHIIPAGQVEGLIAVPAAPLDMRGSN